MKKNKIYLLAAGLLFSLSGCNDYLDKLPDNRTTLDSPEAVTELLVSAYPNAIYHQFTETMSDLVGDKVEGPYVYDVSENRDAYLWNDHTTEDQDTPTYYWANCYEAIAHANQALDAISKVGNPEDYTAQKGEALICRAYSHFMLVNLFSKHYNPTTASSDMGIPYIEEPETVVFADYERGTVQQVYEKIERDLVEGLTLIRDDAYSVAAYHFTRDAANAFASRFYLYKGEWEKVIEHADKVLTGDPALMLRDWNGTYQTMSRGEIMAKMVSSTEKANLLLCSSNTVWARGYYIWRFSLVTEIKDKLFPGTWGTDPFGFAYRPSDAGYDSNHHIPKFDEYFKKAGGVNANIGYPMMMCPLFVAEEVLLNRAEAYAMNNDFGKAFEDLKSFHTKRTGNGAAPDITVDYINNIYTDTDLPYYEETYNAEAFYPIEGDEVNVIRFILDLRKREFIHEGLRWFDIRRFNMEVVHMYEGSEMVLTKNDLRRVIQLPRQAIANGLPANPR